MRLKFLRSNHLHKFWSLPYPFPEDIHLELTNFSMYQRIHAKGQLGRFLSGAKSASLQLSAMYAMLPHLGQTEKNVYTLAFSMLVFKSSNTSPSLEFSNLQDELWLYNLPLVAMSWIPFSSWPHSFSRVLVFLHLNLLVRTLCAILSRNKPEFYCQKECREFFSHQRGEFIPHTQRRTRKPDEPRLSCLGTSTSSSASSACVSTTSFSLFSSCLSLSLLTCSAA